MKFQHVKGTRDFYPDEMARRNWLIDKWREVSRRNGFVEYDGPTFEHLDLYTSKSGEGIVPELYSFEDRGASWAVARSNCGDTKAESNTLSSNRGWTWTGRALDWSSRAATAKYQPYSRITRIGLDSR